jgi:hypothetical protein
MPFEPSSSSGQVKLRTGPFDGLRAGPSRAGASSPRFGPRTARLPWSATPLYPRPLGTSPWVQMSQPQGGGYGTFWDIWDIFYQKIAIFDPKIAYPAKRKGGATWAESSPPLAQRV